MWSYVQTLSPLLIIALAAAICLSVVSFMMAEAKPRVEDDRSQYRRMPPPTAHGYEGE
jgi:hypothetical protein